MKRTGLLAPSNFSVCRNRLDMCSQFFLLLLIFVHITSISTGGVFLVTPGDGDEFVYSPVNVNATLNCAVNSMYLVWAIDTLTFSSDLHRDSIHSRGIFQTEPVTSSDGVTTSNVTVFGNLAENNNSRICCQSEELEESCTVLIIYGRPSPPELMTPQYNELTIEINISWAAIRLIGVDQNYTIYFDSQTIVTLQLFYIYQQNTSDSKIRCNVFITAVNGAGESDPSNNVTIPSLPDIGPVTASLSHQVWKSTSGEIMVNVSFKPAIYCSTDPVSAYVINIMSEMTEYHTVIITNMSRNETEVTIGRLDGLKENKKYHYTVTARSNVGNSMANGNVFVTSDVQSVTATVVRESTIDIQCLFIYGSDAVGCKVVLVSDHPSVNNETATLIRRHTTAFAQLNLTHKVSCYQQVLAYTIDGRNITSTLLFEEKLNSGTNTMCSATGDYQFPSVAIIVSIFLLSLLVVVILVTAISVIKHKKTRGQHRVPSDGIETKENEVYGFSTDGIETTPNKVYGVSIDGIETTPNEVYGVSNEGIETTPNEVYGVSSDSIETTPNEVYGVSTDGIETTPNEVYGVSIKTTPTVEYKEIPRHQQLTLIDSEVFPSRSEMFSESCQFKVYEHIN